MALENYLIGTKEEIDQEIEDKVSSRWQAVAYGYKWVFYESLELGFCLFLNYNLQNSSGSEVLRTAGTMGMGFLVLDIVVRNSVQIKNVLEMFYNDFKSIEKPKQKANEKAKKWATPGLVGVLRKFSKSF